MNTPPIRPGSYPARLSSWIDLGTHSHLFQGTAQPKLLRQVLLTFTVFLPGNQTRLISRRFTLSLASRAGLRKFLESWRGVAFDSHTLEDFHPLKVLEKPALLSITLHPDRQGRLWPQIATIMRLPHGMTAPDLRMPGLQFDLSTPDRRTFLRLPQWIQSQIRTSQQWQTLHQRQTAHHG